MYFSFSSFILFFKIYLFIISLIYFTYLFFLYSYLFSLSFPSHTTHLRDKHEIGENKSSKKRLLQKIIVSSLCETKTIYLSLCHVLVLRRLNAQAIPCVWPHYQLRLVRQLVPITSLFFAPCHDDALKQKADTISYESHTIRKPLTL